MHRLNRFSFFTFAPVFFVSLRGVEFLHTATSTDSQHVFSLNAKLKRMHNESYGDDSLWYSPISFRKFFFQFEKFKHFHVEYFIRRFQLRIVSDWVSSWYIHSNFCLWIDEWKCVFVYEWIYSEAQLNLWESIQKFRQFTWIQIVLMITWNFIYFNNNSMRSNEMRHLQNRFDKSFRSKWNTIHPNIQNAL